MPATGAYTLAMSSNYNGVPRPAAVLVSHGAATVIRRRESRRRPARRGGLNRGVRSATTSAPTASAGSSRSRRRYLACARKQREGVALDALGWPEAIERALALGKPAGVIQLLDRHERDCAALAARLGVPHLVAPDDVADSPFACVPIVRRKRWRESSLWWPATRTLVTADALGTNAFFTAGKAALGVHVLLRLTPPKALARYEPEHVLVGQRRRRGTAPKPRTAPHRPATSRRGLPGTPRASLPFAGRG